MANEFPREFYLGREYNPKDRLLTLIVLGAIVIGLTALAFRTKEGSQEIHNSTYTIMQKYDLNKNEVLDASELDKLLTDFNNKNK